MKFWTDLVTEGTLAATLIRALVTPSLAGGAVLSVEGPTIAEKHSSRLNPIIPVLLPVAVRVLAGQSCDDPVGNSSSFS